MWYVIITSRSLLWLLSSLVATLLMLSALFSPAWLIGPSKSITYDNETIIYSASVGVYTRCTKPSRDDRDYGLSCSTLAARGFATDSEVFPTSWKAAMFFISLGIAVMAITVKCALMSCCFQSICKKSIYIIAGVAQTLSGMCFIVGVMLHPLAWDSTRVQKLCGKTASPFFPGDCSIGLGLWLSIVGTAVTFISGCLSVLADKSTSSDKVQDQIYDDHNLICLP